MTYKLIDTIYCKRETLKGRLTLEKNKNIVSVCWYLLNPHLFSAKQF